MNLFIVILNFNSAKDTILLFEQILSYNIPDTFIQVIDNKSNKTDKRELIKSIPKKNLILNRENTGYAGGNNLGIELAINSNADYVLILNPDIRLTNTTIPTLLSTIKSDNNIAVVGPRICYRNNPKIIYSDGGSLDAEKGYLTKHINSNKNIESIHQDRSAKEVSYVNGSCMLMNIEAIKEIGKLNEAFFLYFEETEWCLRAQKNNYKTIVNVDALAYHESSVKSKNYFFYMTRNRILLSKIEKEYYTITRNKILKNLLKELLNKLTFKKVNPYWFSRLLGFINGVFNNSIL